MKRLITWFVDNPIISNVLMVLIIVGGLVTTNILKMEVFPSFEVDVVTVSVVYPGAAPNDVEESLCVPIEENISGISGIKKISSESYEDYGIVIVEILPGEDVSLIKEQIKSQVDSITNFPKDADPPITAQLMKDTPVLSVSVSGDIDKNSLFNLTKIIKKELDAIEGVNLTKIGVPKSKAIFIKTENSMLAKHGISMNDIELAINLNSIEAPGGKIETQYDKKVIRLKQKSRTSKDIGDIEIHSMKNDSKIKLKDIALVYEDFKNEDIKVTFNNLNASFIDVFRIGGQNALEISKKVNSYVDKKNKLLPNGVNLSIWNDESILLKGRLNLLLKNAFIGLLLVMLVLSVFLKPKFAFWVSLGIPISFLGALWLFPALDVSINMLSLFTFILVLGIVVDDAIVVGENFYKYKEKGYSSRDSAIKGAFEISTPVIFAILTTMATFCPMLFISGSAGSVWKTFPLVVIPILAFSLFESLTILPFHLAHSKDRFLKIDIISKMTFIWDKLRKRVSDTLNDIINLYYRPFLGVCLNNNYLTLSVFLSMLIVTIGIIYSGIVKFNFFPGLENDKISAQITFPEGTPISKTQDGIDILMNSLKSMEIDLDGQINSEDGIVLNVLTVVGAQPYRMETSGRGSLVESSFYGSNKGEVIVELSPSQYRKIKSSEVADKWRNLVGSIPGVKELKFASDLFSAGEDIKFQFNSNDISVLDNVVEDFKTILNQYSGVYDIADNKNKGNKEIIVKMLPKARYDGLDIATITSFIRSAFQGKKIMTIQRGRDEIEVILEFKNESKKSIEDLKELVIKNKFGSYVPLKAVCSLSFEDGYSSISRSDRQRSMFVAASVDPSVANSNNIIASIEKNDIPLILEKYPYVTYTLEGQQKEQMDNLSSLYKNYLIALLIVFILLAIPFKSYYQPFIVMSAIPYGIIGAVFGHLLLGMDFSILSMLGIAALSGVVVNDSLVMMDYINRNRIKKNDIVKAAMESGPARFRPILLTSLTTFMSVLPLIFEKSLQAKFLIPMAVSLGFGVLFSTFVTLILVPCTYVTLENIKDKLIKIRKQLYIN